MESIIQLPSNFVASTTSYMALLISDLSPYLTLVLGVLLAALVVAIIIRTLTR